MKSWVARQFKKLGTDKKAEGVDLSAKVTAFLNTLSSEVDSAQTEEQLVKFEGDTAFSTARETERNTRVIPKRSRKNSAGEEIFDVEEEDAPFSAARKYVVMQRMSNSW